MMNNERIRQLAEEAGYLPDMFGIGHWDSPECKNFAELIVRECMNICDEVQAQYGQYTFTATTCKNRFKEHFGVEE
jgi:hypothetical protein